MCGCAGPVLDRVEIDFFREHEPFGLVLFRRNCEDIAQTRALIAAFRDAVGRPDAPVFVDQEGGRIQRLAPPQWPAYPPARAIGRLAEADPEAGRRAAWLHGRLVAADLRDAGIDANFAPVVDVIGDAPNEIIGDRAFSAGSHMVAMLGRAVAEGLLEGGVMPVVKHIPGYGRAEIDRRTAFPVVDAHVAALAVSDFVPFSELADLPAAMVAYVSYRAVDRHNPATASRVLIRDIIRGRIGFDGLLISDATSMHLLSGDYGVQAAAIHDAGCDIVLHCSGRTEEMRRIGETAPALEGKPLERALRALGKRRKPGSFDRKAAREEFLAHMARVYWPPMALETMS